MFGEGVHDELLGVHFLTTGKMSGGEDGVFSKPRVDERGGEDAEVFVGKSQGALWVGEF